VKTGSGNIKSRSHECNLNLSDVQATGPKSSYAHDSLQRNYTIYSFIYLLQESYTRYIQQQLLLLLNFKNT